MKKPKNIVSISDLRFDQKNYNKGTEFGHSLINRSVRTFGAGRSILVDRLGNVIAGNKTLDNIIDAGFSEDDIIVVQSDGKKLVVVQRTDIDLDSEQGRGLALADNATAKANISWDIDTISQDWAPDQMKSWGILAKNVVDFGNDTAEENIETEATLFFKFPKSVFDQIKDALNQVNENQNIALLRVLKKAGIKIVT